MIPLSTLQELISYNYWARDRQLQLCAKLSQEQLQRNVGGSFGSLRNTLVHLMGVEWVWLERLQGCSPRALPWPELAGIPEISQRWAGVERDLRNYVAGVNEETLVQSFTYTNFAGQTWTYPRWRAILHLINHQSYHRGQVTLLLRLLGAEPPPIDLLVGYDMGFRL